MIEKNKAKDEKKMMPIDRGNYICEKVVGKGVFGTVFKVIICSFINLIGEMHGNR